MITIELHPKQTELFTDPSRFKVACAGRRAGKTYALWTSILNWTQTPMRGTDIYYVAPDKNQGVEISWDLAIDMLGPLILKTNINERVIQVRGSILQRDGSVTTGPVNIKFKGGNDPDSLRGKGLRALALDEYADMKPETWEVALRPTLSDYKAPAIFIGTPKGRNHFFNLYNSAAEDKTGTWAAFKFTSLDNPHIPREEIEQARKELSSQAFAQEYLAEFDTGQSNVFMRDWIRIADKVPAHYRPLVTVDLAGYDAKELSSHAKSKNLDDCAITVGHYFEADMIVSEQFSGRWTTQETARIIISACKLNKARLLGIEKGLSLQALAATLTLEMQFQGWFVQLVPLAHSRATKTDRIISLLQGPLEHGRIRFKDGPYLIKLTDQLIQFPNKNTHDDCVDSLAMLYQLLPEAGVPLSIEDYESDYQPLDPIAGY